MCVSAGQLCGAVSNGCVAVAVGPERLVRVALFLIRLNCSEMWFPDEYEYACFWVFLQLLLQPSCQIRANELHHIFTGVSTRRSFTATNMEMEVVVASESLRPSRKIHTARCVCVCGGGGGG